MNTSNLQERTIQKSQASTVSVSATPTTCLEEQQVKFFDGNEGYVTKVLSEPDETFRSGKTASLDLDSWLARPLKIQEYTWSESLPFGESFNPWSDFVNHPSVKNKLEHYAYLRANLKVKIVVNAAPSLYGTLLAAYNPLQTLNEPLWAGSSGGQIVQMSQLPHLWLRTQQNLGGCICCPFFYNKNWLDLTDLSAFTNMGEVFIDSPDSVVLRSTGGVTTNVATVSVFAWMEDLELSHTTDAPILQGDEYATGPVSNIASAVSSVAKRLTDVPLIGRFAKATEIGAGAIGRIAHIFGFSRTPVIDNPSFVKNVPFGTMANVGMHECVEKLALDPKQELTIDPRTVGLSGIDEMSIKSIVERETYIQSFTWDAAAAADTKIFDFNVTPATCFISMDGWVFPSALAFASHPFQYWRGGIKYRFLITCSQFHRGRLLVQWDPRGVGTISDTNVVVTHVLDLSDTRDFEITIPFANERPMLECNQYFNNPQYTSVTPAQVAYDQQYCNGVLKVFVLNELSSLPGAAADVSISVMISGAPDFEVGAPRDFLSAESIVRAGVIVQGDMEPIDHATTSEGAPVSTDVNDAIETVIPVDSSTIFMGEKVLSFRAMLKRYNYVRMLSFPDPLIATGNFLIVQSHMPRWPLPRGLMDSGFDSGTAGAQNRTRLTLFNYLQGAFVGMRGSSRWKFNSIGAHLDSELLVSRDHVQLTQAGYRVASRGTGSALSTALDVLGQHTFSGYTITNGRTQMGVEVEAPHYSALRFISSSPYSINLGIDDQRTNTDTMTFQTMINNTSLDSVKPIVSCHHAVGDDFSFFFFRYAPQIYFGQDLT